MITFAHELDLLQHAVARADYEATLMAPPTTGSERKYKPEHCRAILAAIDDGHLTRPAIAEATGIPSATVWNYLMGLVDAGQIVMDGMEGQKRVFRRRQCNVTENLI